MRPAEPDDTRAVVLAVVLARSFTFSRLPLPLPRPSPRRGKLGGVVAMRASRSCSSLSHKVLPYLLYCRCDKAFSPHCGLRQSCDDSPHLSWSSSFSPPLSPGGKNPLQAFRLTTFCVSSCVCADDGFLLLFPCPAFFLLFLGRRRAGCRLPRQGKAKRSLIPACLHAIYAVAERQRCDRFCSLSQIMMRL